jgi:hypothetical protein
MRVEGPWFKDQAGRTLMLRGVNLAGSSKVPACPDGATHLGEGFFDHREVSFVGRPFPLEEADEHFSRLRAWGFTFLRFLVTWEAIEHAGPGLYDEAYLDYVVQVVEKAGEHGIQLFIDPHQDAWSRFSGGDGAPGWTFEAAGLEITRFAETGAALVHQVHGDPFPRMAWFTNNSKLAAATMFTLFFGGNDFAPRTQVDGEPVQEFLQRHYFSAVKQLASRLRSLPNVAGYDSFNEPSAGMIGRAFSSLGGFPKGASPTLWQSILLGAGYPQRVSVIDVGAFGPGMIGWRRLNPRGVQAWRDGCECIWKANGVWDVDRAGKPRLLRPEYFRRVDSRLVDFHRDYLKPFTDRFIREIRSVHPGAIVFLEGAPMHRRETLHRDAQDEQNVVHAAHWYDGVTLNFKNFIPWFNVDYRRFRPVLGVGRVQRAFTDQLAEIKRVAQSHMCDCPTFIGEFGVPFDMKSGRAFSSGDFSQQRRALDANFRALEANLLSGTLWNYTPDNTNARGDGWNGEDFSIFSRDQRNGRGGIPSRAMPAGGSFAGGKIAGGSFAAGSSAGGIHDGGRCLEAVVRPYPRATAGTPLRLSFDLQRRVFAYEFRHDPAVQAPTELFVPELQYPGGYRVEVSDGDYTIDREQQTVYYCHSDRQPVHRVEIFPAG